MDKLTVILRVTDGILDGEKYMLLKKLASGISTNHRFLIVPVSPDDLDTLSEMVTTAAFFLDEKNLFSIFDDEPSKVLLKKLAVAMKYMLSGFKTVVDYGEGREERDCTLSIVTPCAHIHIPLNLTDKKTERFVAAALQKAKELCEQKATGYLVYCDEKTEQLVFETKDDYVRRKYFDSGVVRQLEAECSDRSEISK